MKRILLAILFLLLLQLPLYSTTWVVGGKGTYSTSNDHGGGYEGSRTWDQFQGANGEAKYTIPACDYNDATGVITKNGAFAVDLDDLWVNVKEGAAGAWVEKRYKITASTADTITITAGEGANIDVDVWVGGALKADGTGIAEALTELATSDHIYITTNPASAKTYNCAATLTIPEIAGTNNAPIVIKGVDYADGGDLAISEVYPLLQAEAASGLTSGVILIDSASSDYFRFENLVIDGNGTGAATYCIYNSVTGAEQHNYKNCRFTNAISHNVYFQGAYWHFYDCEFDTSGGCGLSNIGTFGVYCKVFGCSFHDNTSDGFYLNVGRCFILLSLFYDNGQHGLNFEAGASYSTVCCNTAYGNTSVGLRFDTASYQVIVFSNSSSGNGTYDYDLDGDSTHFAFFSHNHANTTAKFWSEGVDGTWVAAIDGGNVSGSPDFENVGNDTEDFTPGDDSVLLGAGYPGHFMRDGNPDAITNYGHIGAVTRDEPSGNGTAVNVFINDRSGGKN